MRHGESLGVAGTKTVNSLASDEASTAHGDAGNRRIRPLTTLGYCPARRKRDTLSAPKEAASMKVLGLAGWSGAGKTTLLSKLIPILIGRGLSVSIVKHAHHDFDVDQPGKDSYRLRAAGAGEVIVSSARRWALMHELGDAAEPDLATLLRRLSPCDLVVVEGFKRGRHPKLEIFRTANG